MKKRFQQSRIGQISVLIVFSLIPLFTLFTFVVNMGMLVNAKIALQNGADLAAYAGAATQARQMTAISHLNYQMRQAYKKFIYRYYVGGNYALKCFPHPNSGGNDPNCPNFQSQQAFDFKNIGGQFAGAPVVCINLSQSSNACQLSQSVKLVTPPTGCFPIDPICGVVTQAAQQIAEIQKSVCGAGTYLNLEVALQWLYATEENGKLNTNPDISGMIKGLGLVTENLMNYNRIETLKSFINEPAKTVNVTAIQNLQSVPDLAKVERTILAYKTLQGNLNANVFTPSQIQMKELMPTDMLFLTKVQPEITVPATLFNVNGNSCDLTVSLINARPIFGVYVPDNSPEVFYSIKVEAKARLLFNPFPRGNADPEGITLTAYAAAKPFGSRIGPKLTEQDVVKNRSISVNGTVTPIKVAFLPLDDDYNYDSWGVLESFAKILVPGPQQNFIDTNAFNLGLYAAQFPDEIEIGKYNIPVDVEQTAGGSGMIRYFSSGNSNDVYTVWAPLISATASVAEFKDKIKEEIQNNISYSQTGSTGGPIGQLKADISDYFMKQLDGLVSGLRQKNNYNIAWIDDPFHQKAFDKTSTQRPEIKGKINSPGKSTRLATSYSTVNAREYFESGRDGYSVKLIPMSGALKAAKGFDLRGEKAEASKMQH